MLTHALFRCAHASNINVHACARIARRTFGHLTNFSVNSRSSTFVPNSDPRVPNQGHKWTLAALNAHLHKQGHDVQLLWRRVTLALSDSTTLSLSLSVFLLTPTPFFSHFSTPIQCRPLASSLSLLLVRSLARRSTIW
jgi:hypothetical protein